MFSLGGFFGRYTYTPNESAELPLVWRQTDILGAILLDSSVLPVVLETIRPESFFNEQHKELFQIIFQMFTSGEKADVITVLNAAVERKVFETAAEGRNYLAALVTLSRRCPTSSATARSWQKNITSAAWHMRHVAFSRTSSPARRAHKH